MDLLTFVVQLALLAVIAAFVVGAVSLLMTRDGDRDD